MKVRELSDSTVCVGVSNPDPSNNWATKLEDEWIKHGFVEKNNLLSREVQFIWHVFPGASTLEIKKNIQKYLNGQTPEFFDERIIFMSMSKNIVWTGKKWQHLLSNLSQDTGASRGPGQKGRGRKQVPTNLN